MLDFSQKNLNNCVPFLEVYKLLDLSQKSLNNGASSISLGRFWRTRSKSGIQTVVTVSVTETQCDATPRIG